MSRPVDHIAVTAPQPTAPPATAYKPFNFASASTSGVHHHDTSRLALTRPRTALPEPAGGAGDIMDLDADMIPTSPSADSSLSSSDLDTESTGSFFPDRSTTLGTLMGVSAFGERRAARATAAGEESAAEGAQRAVPDREEARSGVGAWRRRRSRRRRRGRSSLGGSWWRLCRDHGDGGGPPTSLGEFLHMERQLAGAEFLCDGGTGGASGRETAAAAVAGLAATALFEDGRVRPPQPQQPLAAAAAEERGRWRLLRASEGSSSSTTTTSSLARLPVLLTGICSGGAG